jgi:GTPase Era involved in 16S rRNA processing
MNERPRTSVSGLVGSRRREDRSGSLRRILNRAEPLFENALGSASPLVHRVRALWQRLERERLQLAVLGQFKRGKSTFINALLGADLLPTGVIPLTSIATFIAWRQEPLVVVHFRDARADENFAMQTPDAIRDGLFRYVAEEANPENQLGVARVELFYPAEILRDGTVIIDTPGVGSTLRHNTEAALQVIPECDAAFFVISADPPITETELVYLRRLKAKIPRIFFVLNKVDYLRFDEQRRVSEFLQEVLAEKSLFDSGGRIFCVSARNGLLAKLSGNAEALEASGISKLEDHLVIALACEKSSWLQDAVRNKATDILAQGGAEIELRVHALNMPVDELAAKLDQFRSALISIEEQRRIIRDLLDGDHRRLRDRLDSRTAELRKEVGMRIAGVIDASLSGAVPKRWKEETRLSLSAAMETEFEKAREPTVSAFATDAGAALRSYHERIEALVERVRQTAAQIFDVVFEADREREEFQLGEDPYWVTEDTSASLIPDPSGLLDGILPASLRRSRLRARIVQQAEQMIIRNAENLRWAIVRGLDETFRKATARFEERLDQTIAATRDVINDTLERRGEQSFAVAPELDRLSAASVALGSLREELVAFQQE